MPSRGLSVDVGDRNDVLSFYQAIYQASEGYENRPVFKTHATANFYEPDFTVPYVYVYNISILPPILIKLNGEEAEGELDLGFVKDVERRVNYHRAMVELPAAVTLMDSDTQKSSAVVQLSTDPSYAAFQPPATTLKADAAQKSAYMIARSFKEKWGITSTSHTTALNHILSTAQINAISAWNKEAWNGNQRSNLALGFYGPTAVDNYVTEEFDSTTGANVGVGHRRGIFLPNATRFATGDVPGLYNPSATDLVGNPKLRQSVNALYVGQTAPEVSRPSPSRFTAYPPAGYFPATLNSPYWSLYHPQANFTGATVVMTNSSGTPVTIGAPTISTQSISWWVKDTTATEKNISADRTYNITVSNFTLSGSPTTRSYSVTLINPNIITTHPQMAGSSAPPAGGSATYLFNSPEDAEAVQINSFQEVGGSWVENADTVGKVIPDVYGNYAFLSGAYPVSGGLAFHLTHAVRKDVMVNGVPDESFMIDREIIPSPSGTSRLKFFFRRASITANSFLAIEKSADDGASWTTMGTIVGTNADSSAVAADLPLGTSSTPLLVRFRYSKTGSSIFTQEEYPGQNTGIFIDNISTTNTTTYELRKTNDLDAKEDQFVLDSTTAGIPLVAGQPLHLRFRSKLGGHWYQYGPPKIIAPTDTPIPGFSGWITYNYPMLTGGFTGDHDGDGVPNAIEFAFYQDPLNPGTTSDKIAFGRPPSDGDGPVTRAVPPDSLMISREIPQLRTGIVYGAEWSDTLAPNSWTTAGVTVFHDGTSVIAHVAKGPGKRFLRWKISEP